MYKKILSILLLWLSLILINIVFIKLIFTPPLTQKIYVASSAFIPTSSSIFQTNEDFQKIHVDSLISIIQGKSLLSRVAGKKYEMNEYQLDLISALNKNNLEDCIKALRKAISVSISKEDVIYLKVTLPNPYLASSVVNTIIEEVDNILTDPQRLVSEAEVSNIEEELAKKKDELEVLEKQSKNLIQSKADKSNFQRLEDEYEQLLKQLEDTKLMAAANRQSIQVLDWAIPPSRPLSGTERVSFIYRIFHLFLNSLVIFLFWYAFFSKADVMKEPKRNKPSPLIIIAIYFFLTGFVLLFASIFQQYSSIIYQTLIFINAIFHIVIGIGLIKVQQWARYLAAIFSVFVTGSVIFQITDLSQVTIPMVVIFMTLLMIPITVLFYLLSKRASVIFKNV